MGCNGHGESGLGMEMGDEKVWGLDGNRMTLQLDDVDGELYGRRLHLKNSLNLGWDVLS